MIPCLACKHARTRTRIADCVWNDTGPRRSMCEKEIGFEPQSSHQDDMHAHLQIHARTNTRLRTNRILRLHAHSRCRQCGSRREILQPLRKHDARIKSSCPSLIKCTDVMRRYASLSHPHAHTRVTHAHAHVADSLGQPKITGVAVRKHNEEFYTGSSERGPKQIHPSLGHSACGRWRGNRHVDRHC